MTGNYVTDDQYSDMKSALTNVFNTAGGGLIDQATTVVSDFMSYYNQYSAGGLYTGIRAYFALDVLNHCDIIYAVSGTVGDAGYTWASTWQPIATRAATVQYVGNYFADVKIEGAAQAAAAAGADNIYKISIYHDWADFTNCIFNNCQGDYANYALKIEFGYITHDYCNNYGLDFDHEGLTVIYSLLDHNGNTVMLNGTCKYYDTGKPCPQTCGSIQQWDVINVKGHHPHDKDDDGDDDNGKGHKHVNITININNNS